MKSDWAYASPKKVHRDKIIKKMKEKNKLGQEEMIGFALILILVAIIVLVFIGFSIRSPQKESVESYEVESFLQSMLQYTTECENNIERLSVQKLVFACNAKEKCLDEKNSCEVLKLELEEMLKESWPIGEERPVKGYELIIMAEGNESILDIREGDITANSKGSSQDFFRSQTLIEVLFEAYY